jgi:hypothetical protein
MIRRWHYWPMAILAIKAQSELRAPYYNASRRSFTFTLVLWLVLVLLVFTGLGVFRLYFDFELMSGDDQSGQLFSLKIRGGQSFNIFESERFAGIDYPHADVSSNWWIFHGLADGGSSICLAFEIR